MKGHLNVQQISDWLAARKSGDAADPDVGHHLDACDACRAAVDKADALLDVAATMETDDSLGCPDEIELSAYADGTVSADERIQVRGHVEACPVCRDVVRALSGVSATGRLRRRVWTTGFAILATAAVLSVFFILPEPQDLDVRVAVSDIDPRRSSEPDAGEKEFEVEVTVAEPGWASLLVIDRSGELTFLAEKQVETNVVFGRYGVWPPDQSEHPQSLRAYVLIISAKESLVERLGEFEHNPAPLSDDPAKASTQVNSIGDRIEKQFDCKVRSAPIVINQDRQ